MRDNVLCIENHKKYYTIDDITKNKRGRDDFSPLVVLTAYTTPVARLLDSIVDILLVGDSVGTVLYGMDDLQDVTIEMMVQHAKAVRRGAKQSLVVVDMPFGTYVTKNVALHHAKMLMAAGADAVKVEGGSCVSEIIRHLTSHDIPVMGHLGFTSEERDNLTKTKSYQYILDYMLYNVVSLESAGVFSCILECVPDDIAHDVSKNICIPTIGFGASPFCDGQALVVDDMMGACMMAFPQFTKSYGSIPAHMEQMAKRYAYEVKSGLFPSSEYCLSTKKMRK